MGVYNLVVLACVLRTITKIGRQLKKSAPQKKSWLRLWLNEYTSISPDSISNCVILELTMGERMSAEEIQAGAR